MCLKAPSVSDVFMETLKVMEEFDKEKVDETPAWTKITKDILAYLWEPTTIILQQ